MNLKLLRASTCNFNFSPATASNINPSIQIIQPWQEPPKLKPGFFLRAWDSKSSSWVRKWSFGDDNRKPLENCWKILKNNQCCRGKFNFPRCFLKPPAVSNHTWKTWPSRQKSLLPIPSQKNARVFYPSRTLGCCDRRVQDAFLWSYPAPLGRCGGVAGPWPLPTLPTPQPTAAAARGRTCAPPNGDADKALFFRTEGTNFCHVITANNLYPKKASWSMVSWVVGT